MMDTNRIQVQMLGGLSVSYHGAVVGGQNDRSRKVKSLLAYLLYHHGRMIPVEELVNMLGGGQKNAAPVAAFRTMLYRVRRAVEPIQNIAGQPLILTQNGMCGWNPAVEVELDAEQLERMCRTDAPEGPAAIEHHRHILSLYQGEFLCGLPAEQWVEPLAEYYRGIYLSALETAAPVLLKGGFASDVECLCREAMRQSPYHEALYRWLMCAQAAQDDRKGAAAVYEELRTQLYEDLGVMPEEETQRVYWEIVRGTEDRVLTADSIRVQLREFSLGRGAFICDYGAFKLFYQAEARAAARRGDAIHIGVLSVLAREGRMLSAHSLARVMEQLRTQIQQNLRSGDIASCCSASQYILMLVQANYENSRQVCERVVQAFVRSRPRSPVRIQTTVFPLEPAFEPLGGAEDNQSEDL